MAIWIGSYFDICWFSSFMKWWSQTLPNMPYLPWFASTTSFSCKYCTMDFSALPYSHTTNHPQSKQEQSQSPLLCTSWHHFIPSPSIWLLFLDRWQSSSKWTS
jgi:hypothetical protein